MGEKSKSRPVPPDYRLARAFHFTGEDLAVNRSGYMTRKQQGLLNVVIQYVLDWTRQKIFRRESQLAKRGFWRVQSVCGRVRLEQYLPDHRYRTFRGEKYLLFFRLVIETTNFQIALTEEQFAALSNGLNYRIYYSPANSDTILSLERVIGSCDEVV